MTELASLVTTPTPVPLRVEDYLRLDEAGAFADYRKTELIEGQIYYMNSQYRPHARVKSALFVEVVLALRSMETAFTALVEASVSVPPHNVPEPDIVVTSDPEGDGLIPLGSVALVVEVADTTLTNDLGRKHRIYAGHGVPEYWVVDVNARLIHQMSRPAGNSYIDKEEVSFGEPLKSVAIPGLTVPTTSL